LSALLAGREFESSRNKLFIAYTIKAAKRTITKRSFKSSETRVFALAVSQISGKRLTYAELTGKVGETTV
jgi:hypothetical protein